jgi:uncharacterized membrane protein YdbT with pleckstrin-like domain
MPAKQSSNSKRSGSSDRTKRAVAKHEFPIPFITRKTPILLFVRVVGAIFVLQAFYVMLRVVVPENAGINVDSALFFLFILAVQFTVLIYVYLEWFNETYEIHEEDLVHRRGILFRREKAYPFNNMQTIACHQSPLGRIYHYGEVRIFIPTLGDELQFQHVPHPHHFIHTVRHVLPYPDRNRFIVHG